MSHLGGEGGRGQTKCKQNYPLVSPPPTAKLYVIHHLKSITMFRPATPPPLSLAWKMISVLASQVACYKTGRPRVCV